MKSNSFELGFVHLDDLIFHETCDFKRVQRLAGQIQKDAHLKNPVLVAAVRAGNESTGSPSHQAKKFMVLDGVNRICALRLLGISDVLVQKVDLADENVGLSSWDHLIFKGKKESLASRFETLNLEMHICDRGHKKQALEDQRTVCCLLFRDESGLVIKQKTPYLDTRVKNLYRVIALYNGIWEIFHPGWDDGLISPFENFENATAINALPKFRKDQVVHLASRGILLPFGVTRFVVLQRILGLEVSCSVLGDSASLCEKNLFLRELLSYRIKSKKAKFYQESVFLFNE